MRSKPDGRTLMQTTTSAFGTVPYFQHVPYNVERDFTYIGQYASQAVSALLAGQIDLVVSSD